MSSSNKHITITPVASTVPYDDAIQSPASGTSDVQAMLDYLKNIAANSASPGFTFGRSGNLPVSTWLLNDTVPCNKAGRVNYLYNCTVSNIYVSNENPDIVKLAVYTHDGDENALTLVGTVTTAAQRTNSFSVSFSIGQNKQIAIKIADDSPNAGKNTDVGLVLRGTLT